MESAWDDEDGQDDSYEENFLRCKRLYLQEDQIRVCSKITPTFLLLHPLPSLFIVAGRGKGNGGRMGKKFRGKIS